ncbi:hypothetical protein [Streptomyces sp. NPDC059071]|uniref:hypothetical protein n=1 Tax=unclassified Streptomyces TaxID=2593676 RepID=UPI00365CF1EF
MTEHPGFGAVLGRLLKHRGLGVQELADRAGLTAEEVRAVLAGEPADEGLLLRLAPALHLHAVDLFILAGRVIPDDLAPLDATARPWVPYVVMNAAHLPAERRREVLEIVRSLPQEERRSDVTPERLAAPAGGPGGRVVRMFRYRNLDWPGMAKTLAVVTPTYLSAPTYGVIGAGRKQLTPRLVTDFAALLAIDARELAVLTDIVLPGTPPPPAPEAVDSAALLWEARRLSATQVRHVAELARSMRGDSGTGYIVNLPGS